MGGRVATRVLLGNTWACLVGGNSWLSVRTVGEVFAECLYPPACLGGPNPSLENKFENENGMDLAKVRSANQSGTCASELGFQNQSRLCHTCKEGNRRHKVNQCARCPTTGQNWGFIILGMIVIFGLVIFVVNSILKEGDSEDLSQSIKKIMLNYLRLSPRKSFRFRPESLLRFEIQGALSTLEIIL